MLERKELRAVKGAWNAANRRLQLWQLLRIPAAAERFDQQDAGVELPTHEIDVVALVGKGHSLRSNHFEIEFETALIARLESTEGLQRCAGCAMLLLLFRLQNAQ